MNFLSGVALFTLCSVANAVQPIQQLEVFTTAQYPVVGAKTLQQVKGISVVVYQVDQVDQLHALFSKALPAAPEAAQQEVFRRMKAHPEWVKSLSEGWTSRVKAQRYHLKTIPAVVPDSDPSRAVYQETNLIDVIKTMSRMTQ